MIRPIYKQTALALLAVGWAAAFPSSGTLNLNGYGNFVGTFTISSAPGLNEPTVSGYGGGFGANIASNVIEVFCIDFANDVDLPSSHSVNVTPIAAGTQFTKDTRSGAVTSWRPLENYLPAGLTVTPALQTAITAIDNASALQRYEMAAYLVSNYTFFNQQPPQSSNAYYGDATDRGIQSAIWAIMDPSSDAYLPPSSLSDSGNIAAWLEKASAWLPTANNAANQQLLSRFRIVSDSQIASSSTPTRVGIQEFLTVVPVPEPSFYVLLTAGLAILFFAARRKQKAV
jgi:hypothetical protein